MTGTTMKPRNEALVRYIGTEIIPRYAHFDKAHRVEHVRTVIEQSLLLAEHYDVDPDMVYTVAAYHDTGLAEGRETHHTVSARILRADRRLQEWFTPEQIDTMADAAEDHRASSQHEPRTIYGRIVAEADRIIDTDTIVRRTVQFGLSHHPELDREGQYERVCAHISEKYDYGGYLRLWIPESPNASRLEAFRRLFRDKEAFRRKFEEMYADEVRP